MSAVPAPHVVAGASAPKRAPVKTSASAWVPLPEEENTRYLPKPTPLKPFISAHFISNDGEAAPKTSRRRTYTPDERKRVANTRKYGACKECRARKVTCSHVPIPPAAAIDEYLRETQRHEIFALALNTTSSVANVNVHKESMTKRIADIGDKLSEPQDNTKPSTGVATEALAGDTVVTAVLSPAAPIPLQAPSRRTTLKAPAQVYNATRARSPSRTQQPGTGKFRLQPEPTSGEGRVKRLKPDAPGSKNLAGRPTKAVKQLNAQASSNMIVISHVPPPAPAHIGKSHHEWREDGPQIVVTNHPPRVSYSQNQYRFAREARLIASDACVMHYDSAQSLMRRPSSSSGRDSLDSDMGEMITSSARSASSSGDFRPLTPLNSGYQLLPVVEKNITFTTAAVPTEYDVKESTCTQTLASHRSDDLSISWTDLLNLDLELDDDILDQDAIVGFRPNTTALLPQNRGIDMPGNAGNSAMAKQPLPPPTELMDVDKV